MPRFWTPIGLVAAVAALLTSCAAPPLPAATLGVPAAEPTAERAVPTAAPAPVRGSGLPASAPGYRWTSMLNVAVQVPAAWGYEVALGQDWCAARDGAAGPPQQPFVAVHRISRVLRDVHCSDAYPPEEQQVEHLEWTPAQRVDKAGDSTHHGWVYSRRIIGEALLTYVHRAGQDADALFDTARVVKVDPNGCPVRQPTSERPSAATLSAAPDDALVCQYATTYTTANLVASRRLGADEAATLLAAMDDAPAIGRPRVEGWCPVGELGTTVSVRFRAGELSREVRLSLLGAVVPVSIDDGSTYRRPTRSNCADVFTRPIWWPTWLDEDAAACAAR